MLAAMVQFLQLEQEFLSHSVCRAVLCIGLLQAVFIFVINDTHIPIESENCSSLPNSKSRNGSWPSQCPLWFTVDEVSGKCRRGPHLDGIIEQDTSLMRTRVMQCYCQTEDDGVYTISWLFSTDVFVYEITLLYTAM